MANFKWPGRNFEIERHWVGDICVLEITGSITADGPKMLHDAVREVFDDGFKSIVLDVRNAANVDSSGLSVFVQAAKMAYSSGGRMALAGLQGRIHRILELSQMVSFFEAYDSAEEAVTKIRQQMNLETPETGGRDRAG